MNYDFIKNIRYFQEKKRFLLFVLILFFCLLASIFLFRIAYARYELQKRLVADIDKALYIFRDEDIRFNLEPRGIIPSSSPYVYNFSISNYNDDHDSDVDLSYHIALRTTTNLPLTYKLYRNEDYRSPTATNILEEAVEEQDEDDSWYYFFDVDDEFEMYYANQTTDVYTLVINFDSSYAVDTTYANAIENIEVILNSRQII